MVETPLLPVEDLTIWLEKLAYGVFNRGSALPQFPQFPHFPHGSRPPFCKSKNVFV